jgi:signal peptidase II
VSKGLPVGVTALTILVTDQLTKWWIRTTLPLYDSFPVFDSFFHIVHYENPGGAFSLLAGQSASWRLPFFVITALIAIGVLFYFIRETDRRQVWILCALGAVMGGAVGNLIDRAVLGTVTDFLDVHINGWHWPAFNIADSGITVGTITVLLHSLVNPPVEDSAPEPS